MLDDGGKAHADLAFPLEVRCHFGDACGDRLGGRRMWRGDAETLARQLARFDVHRGALDARTTNVNAENDVCHIPS